MKIIFLFGLPRSGTTLLQRLLTQTDKIVTTSEPWLLLPLLTFRKKDQVFSYYNSRLARKAINNMFISMDDGEAIFKKCVRNFAIDVYSEFLSNEKQYFLDKTPRYYMVCDQIVEIFNDAKFIFIFRNPISQFASIINTWHNGKLLYTMNKYDLFYGPQKIIETYRNVKDRSIKINYEKLVTEPEKTIKKIYSYLQINDVKINRKKIINKKHYLFGDKPYNKNINEISEDSIEKWKKIVNSNYRKKVVKKYLLSIGRANLKDIGYDFDELISQLNNHKTRRLINIRDYAYRMIDLIGQLVDYKYQKAKYLNYKRNSFLSTIR